LHIISNEFKSLIPKFKGLGCKGLEFRGLEFESLISDPRHGLGGPEPEMFLGFDFPGLRLGLVNYWACQRLIHDPIVTPKFPCLDDYENSSVLIKWIKLSRTNLISGLGLFSRLDQF
jgi:hypothetical protein